MVTGDGGLVQLDLAGVFSADSNSCITYMCVASHHSSAMLSWLFPKNMLLRTVCICPMRPAQCVGDSSMQSSVNQHREAKW